jgi:hypothetical protein
MQGIAITANGSEKLDVLIRYRPGEFGSVTNLDSSGTGCIIHKATSWVD